MDKGGRLLLLIFLGLSIGMTGAFLGAYSAELGQHIHRNQMIFHSKGVNHSFNIQIQIPANDSIVIVIKIRAQGQPIQITYNYTMPSALNYYRQTWSQTSQKRPFHLDIIDFLPKFDAYCEMQMNLSKAVDWELYIYQNLNSRDVSFYEGDTFSFVMLFLTPAVVALVSIIILAPLISKSSDRNKTSTTF
jgi:hypothetical protein